ncbi:nitroreductase [Elusimicrobium simillimum]|uniref:nitroreductase family protein n=1 Tax=Elusimicrobium simillimum TaxID=3143438 RepID=UPI003C701B80
METKEAIFKRRSIRKYKNIPLDQAQVEALLRAAMAAPTGRNIQDWRFVVVRERGNLQKIMLAHPYAKMVETAPLAIIVCSDFIVDNAARFWEVDCAAAIQNIMIAATGMGLGSVWLGVSNDKARLEGIKKYFELPENIMPVGIVVVGTADEEKQPEDRYDPAKVHYEKW